MVLEGAARQVCRWTLLGAAAAVPTCLGLRWLEGAAPLWSLLLPAAGVVTGLISAWWLRPGDAAAARRIDRSHDFNDALATAVALRDGAAADPAFASLQRAAAERMAGQLDLRRLGRRMPGRGWWWLTGASLAALAAAFVVPLPKPADGPARPGDDDAAKLAGRDASTPRSEPMPPTTPIERRAERIRELARTGDLSGLAQEMEAMERTLRDAEQTSPPPSALAAQREPAEPTTDRPPAQPLAEAAARDANAAGANPQDEAAEPMTARERARSAAKLGDAAAALREARPPGNPAEPSAQPAQSESEGTRTPERTRTDAADGTRSRSEAPSGPAKSPDPDAPGPISQKNGGRDWNTPPSIREDVHQRGTTGERDQSPSSANGSVPDQGLLTREEKGSRQTEGAQGKGNTWTPQSGDHKSPDSTEPAHLRPHGSEGKGGQPRPEKGAAEPVFGGTQHPTPAPGELERQAQGQTQKWSASPEAREALSQRLEELSRRVAGERSGADGAGLKPGTDGRDSGPDGRDSGPDAPIRRESPASPSAAGTYDLTALPPDPDRPGGTLDGTRPRDAGVPVQAPQPLAGGANGPANTAEAAAAPRFRPLLRRYFERRPAAPPAPPAP